MAFYHEHLSQVHIIFRYDDFSADQPGDRAANPLRMELWMAEQEIAAIFRQFAMPHVLGVVPAINTDDSYERPFRKCQGVIPLSADLEKCHFLIEGLRAREFEVAMHGFRHTNHAPACWAAAEFHRAFDQQLADLQNGRSELRKVLGDHPVTSFIPPYNSWNESTLRALEATGFTVLSADLRQALGTDTHLRFMPFTAQLWEVESNLDKLAATASGGIIVVLYHPPQIVCMPGRETRFFGTARFARLLEKLANDPRFQVTTLRELPTTDTPLDAARYRATSRVWRYRSIWRSILPGMLMVPRSGDDLLYHRTEDCQSEIMRSSLLFTAAWVLCAMFAGILAHSVGAFCSTPWNNTTPVIGGLVVIGAALRWIDLKRRGFLPSGMVMSGLPVGIGLIGGWLIP